jgi:hypothetical protein
MKLGIHLNSKGDNVDDFNLTGLVELGNLQLGFYTLPQKLIVYFKDALSGSQTDSLSAFGPSPAGLVTLHKYTFSLILICCS